MSAAGADRPGARPARRPDRASPARELHLADRADVSRPAAGVRRSAHLRPGPQSEREDDPGAVRHDSASGQQGGPRSRARAGGSDSGGRGGRRDAPSPAHLPVLTGLRGSARETLERGRMLVAREESTRAQRQLVADASHELRTPLTSLRTNIEVLASDRVLPPEERQRLISDVVEQVQEMTTLIAELIELARAEQQTAEPEDVRLDLVAAAAPERARRDRSEIVFTAELVETTVRGVPSTIERAIANLLD